MQRNRTVVRRTLLLFVFLGFLCCSAVAQTARIPNRITQAVDATKRTVLHGNVHPLARLEFDQGIASDAQPLKRMLLLLQRSPEQEAALQKLLDDQQNGSSPSYHAWLLPEEFGRQFGPADADIQTVSAWLSAQGFTEIKVGLGRTVIEFSGNSAQVRNAFNTEIHRFVVDGQEHVANATDPQIPAALAPVIAGPVALNNFPVKSFIHPLGTFQKSKATGEIKPLFTYPGCRSGNCFGVGPADFATIYNTAPLLNGTPRIDGSGQTIAIVGESNIDVQDVVDFRTMFGLPQNFSSKNIILNGPDPGVNPSEGESDLDVQWAGAVAPAATIDFVTSASTEATAGIFLSATYIVDNNLAGVMSESFGACEQRLGTLNQFHNALWEQAAAQGITVMLSAGDGGSAGCDNFNTAQTATRGLGVSGFASTPFNVAVGGTDFDDVGRESTYWNTSPTSIVTLPVPSSALSYIPEVPWNDSCAQDGLNGCTSGSFLDIIAGSGGVSTIYSKPSWQSGTGVPNDGQRDLPDVSLFASNGFNSSFYIMCQRDVTGAGSCNLTNAGFTFQGVGGTSASSPAFAGIMALVNQKAASRQGNANYVLYALAKKSGASCNSNLATSPPSTCIFYDVTKGNNSVPCTGGSPNCSSASASINGVLVPLTSASTPAYTAATGYDLATGLGSVNAQNLVNNWSSVSFKPSSTTLTLNNNNPVSITHGQSVSFSVAVSPGAATGDVSLLGSPSSGNSAAVGISTLRNGTAGGTTSSLPGGTSYQLIAHYEGDGTYAASDSSPVTISVKSESSKTLISIPVFSPNTGRETGNTPTSLGYGSPYIARIDVGNANAVLSYPPQTVCTPPSCPTGPVTWTDAVNGGPAAPLDGGSFALNVAGYAEDLPIQLSGGKHVLTASYSGDKSYGASSSTYNLSITPAATRIGPSNPPLPPVVATPLSLGVILTTDVFGAMPSCNLTFYDGTTALPGTVTCAWQANGPFLYTYLLVPQATSGTHTYSAKFNGDSNYLPSASAPMFTRVYYGTITTLTADSTSVQYGSSITLTAVVDSTLSQGPAIGQAVTFLFDNNPVSGTVTYTPFTDSSGNLALRASLTTVPQSSGFYTANFAGDSNYFQSGALLNVSVSIPDFSLSANLPSSSITAGNSGIATITVTPAGNSSSSPVTLACPPPGLYGTPAGISCSFSPGTVNLSNGTAATSTLTISTLAPSSTPTTSLVLPQPPSLYLPPRLFWPLPIASLALFSLFLLPARLRRSPFALVRALACCLFILLSFVGCGGGSGGGGGGGGGGPVPTTITLTTSSVKVAYSPTSGGVVNLTANIASGKAPAGTVTVSVDGSAGYSVTSPVVAGVAQIQLTNLSVGIHTLTAGYSGDASTLSSQTKGSLNIAVTGQTGVSVQANTGGLFHTIVVNFTLQ